MGKGCGSAVTEAGTGVGPPGETAAGGMLAGPQGPASVLGFLGLGGFSGRRASLPRTPNHHCGPPAR